MLAFGVTNSLLAFVPPFAAGQFAIFGIQVILPSHIADTLLLQAHPLHVMRTVGARYVSLCPTPSVSHSHHCTWCFPDNVRWFQAPNTAVVLWSVPSRLRPFAMSLQVIVIHVFGDVPSPVLLGWLQERIQNWRCATCGLQNNSLGCRTARPVQQSRVV